jgi:hypothetical protein
MMASSNGFDQSNGQVVRCSDFFSIFLEKYSCSSDSGLPASGCGQKKTASLA